MAGKADLKQRLRWEGAPALGSSLEHRAGLGAPAAEPPEAEATPRPPGHPRPGRGRALTAAASCCRSAWFQQQEAPHPPKRAKPPRLRQQRSDTSRDAPPAPGRRMEWSPSRASRYLWFVNVPATALSRLYKLMTSAG